MLGRLPPSVRLSTDAITIDGAAKLLQALEWPGDVDLLCLKVLTLAEVCDG
jgi:hypothetical protein